MKMQLVLLSGLLLLCSAAPQTPKPKLLYILLDGFRWDYIDDPLLAGHIPGFRQLVSEGVRAQHVNPIFPSLSYPSWTTLSTGLYAESHGIVGNYFYDPEDDTTFSLFDANSTGNPKWWKNIEPIWTTATKSSLDVALYLWGRCDVAFGGVTPKYCKPFVKIPGKEIFRTNIEKALERFEEGYDLVQVYTEHVDTTGHNFGPESDERRQAVKDIDATIQFLLKSLEEKNLSDTVNIVIVSDHGMTDTDPAKVPRPEIDDYLPSKGVANIADKGAFSNLLLDNKNSLTTVVQKLSQMANVTVWRHEDIPEKYHIKNSPYVHDIVISADPGTWVMASNDSGRTLPPRSSYTYRGGHGYRPEMMDMKSIFFARGPAFKKDFTLDPIEIVDIYQVLTRVLGIKAVPNNGTASHINAAFASGIRPLVCVPLILAMAALATSLF